MKCGAAAVAFAISCVGFVGLADATPERATSPNRPHVSLALEGGSVSYISSAGLYGGYMGGLAIRAVWDAGYGFGTGVRYSSGRLLQSWGAIDGYATAFVAPSFGAWNPRAGIELGLSTAHRFVIPAIYPAEFDENARPLPGPFYVGVDVSPLRFRFSHFSFALAAVGLALPIPTASTLRVTLRFAEIEWRF